MQNRKIIRKKFQIKENKYKNNKKLKKNLDKYKIWRLFISQAKKKINKLVQIFIYFNHILSQIKNKKLFFVKF